MDYPKRLEACNLWKTYSPSTIKYVDSNLCDFFDPDMKLFTFGINFNTVGCCLVSKDGTLLHLVVHPEHRRNKIATHLIKCAIRYISNLKAEVIDFGDGRTTAAYKFFSNHPHFELYGTDKCERGLGLDYQKYIFKSKAS